MFLAYCDYIADQIRKGLGGKLKASRVKYDLHPTEGYMLSTKKTLEVEDWNGKKYKVTVEEMPCAEDTNPAPLKIRSI